MPLTEAEELELLELEAAEAAGSEGSTAPAKAPRPVSSYEGVPDAELNWLQRLERAGVKAGLVKPGMELLSPGALTEKKKAAAVAANDLALGYGPQIVGAGKALVPGGDDYLTGRDKAAAYLSSAEGGTAAVGHGIGALGSLALPSPQPLGPGKTPLRTFARAVAPSAAVGGAYGLLANPGDEKGKVSPLQLPQRTRNAALGAGIAGTVAVPLGAVSALRQALAAKPGAKADEIVRIAKDLGIPEEQIPTELLTDDLLVRDKAAAMQRDPTLGGAIVRKKLQPFQNAIEERAERMMRDAAPATETAASVGTTVRSEIPKVIEGRLAPAKASYERITGPMQGAQPRGVSFKSGTTKLLKSVEPGDPTGELRSLIEQEREHFFGKIDTVDKLKAYRTSVGQRATEARRLGNDQRAGVLDEIYGILTRERDRTLLREAIKTGPKIARGGKNAALVKELQAADKLYRDTLSSSMEALGTTRSAKQSGQAAIRRTLEKPAVDQLPDVLWSGRDSEQAAQFAREFPEQHEAIRRLQLQRVRDAASRSGTLSPTSLQTQLRRVSPEARTRLLGKEAGGYKDWNQLLQAMPDPNFNPSRTSVRESTLSNWNPLKQGRSVLGAAELALRRPLQYARPSWTAQQLAGQGSRMLPLVGASTSASRPPQEQQQLTLSRVEGTKYAPALQAAAQRGPDSFAATQYLLGQSDPEFRALFADEEESVDAP